jgi:hypothetical protein
LRAKWNKPVYDEDPECIEVLPNGTVRRGLRGTYCDEDVDMFRVGHKCIQCDEPQPTAFPEKCLLCEFPMRELQAEAFAERFAGWRPMGSSIDWDEEQERLERQRHARLQAERASRSRIWVPSQ